MKSFKSILFLLLFFCNSANTYATDGTMREDPNLTKTLATLKEKALSIHQNFPKPPTDADFVRLETNLFEKGGKLPDCLKQLHFVLGHYIIFGVEFPTAHSTEQKQSEWLDFIRKGYEKNIPKEWLPFCLDGTDFICCHLGTHQICYFYNASKVKKEKEEYSNLSTWIGKRLL
jgi:hypothetical protein